MKKLTIFLFLFFTFLVPLVYAGPYTATSTYSQWKELLSHEPDQNSIRPLQEIEWDLYMAAWHTPNNNVEGEPYPPTQFLTLDQSGLYVSRTGAGSYPPLDEPDCGLVMTWGNDQLMPGSYASAWVFQYGQDPDLSNKTITVTVFPPQWGGSGQINQVSFGMRDIYGNIRSWYWNCGPMVGSGMLPWNISTSVQINTSLTGLAAGNPAAAGYLNTSGFDITQVVDFIVDENAAWVGGPTPVPPDGVAVGRLWNYWKDLIVLPNDPIANKGYFIKYSQPAVEIKPGIILGWDEKSLYNKQYKPIMADDFLCKDDRPITDFHWWGSFLGWNKSELPPVVPIAFHIGIWTDIPDPNPQDPKDWSMPGKMVWEHICTNWTWNFSGFDKHPQALDQYTNEACFQFNQLLSEPDWFYQKPGTNVYWLSIAAIYPDDTQQIQYPWGWKTRPHKFNDPAYQIMNTINPDGTIAWPPTIYSSVNAGNSVLINQLEPWDLAFEISTNKPAYHDNPIPGDIDANGIVDLLDFAQLAQNWLRTYP